MIDIHSHILPGVDDGSKNIRMTLDMLRNAEKEGTTAIIATPHFCRGYGEATYQEVMSLCSSIKKLSDEEKINLDIHYGQEIFYSKNMISDYKEKTIGTLADSSYILFELPLQGNFEREMLEDIYELQVMGLKPILAHPERYKFIKEKPYMINQFIEEGILFQMNSGSIQGDFGKDAKRVATAFLKNGIYNFIGSDAHNNTNRSTGIKEGIELSIEKNKMYEKLFEVSGEKLLNNKDIKFYGEKIREKKRFGFFGK